MGVTGKNLLLLATLLAGTPALANDFLKCDTEALEAVARARRAQQAHKEGRIPLESPKDVSRLEKTLRKLELAAPGVDQAFSGLDPRTAAELARLKKAPEPGRLASRAVISREEIEAQAVNALHDLGGRLDLSEKELNALEKTFHLAEENPSRRFLEVNRILTEAGFSPRERAHLVVSHAVGLTKDDAVASGGSPRVAARAQRAEPPSPSAGTERRFRDSVEDVTESAQASTANRKWIEAVLHGLPAPAAGESAPLAEARGIAREMLERARKREEHDLSRLSDAKRRLDLVIGDNLAAAAPAPREPQAIAPTLPENRFTKNVPLSPAHHTALAKAAAAHGLPIPAARDWRGAIDHLAHAIDRQPGAHPLEKGQKLARIAADLDAEVISKLPADARRKVNYQLGTAVMRLEEFRPEEFRRVKAADLPLDFKAENTATFERYLPYTQRYLKGDLNFVEGSLLNLRDIRELEAHNAFPVQIAHDMRHVHFAVGHPMGASMVFGAARSRHPERWALVSSAYESVDTLQYAHESKLARYFDQTRNMDIEEGMTWLARATDEELAKVIREAGIQEELAQFVAEDIRNWRPHALPGEDVSKLSRELDGAVEKFGAFRDDPKLAETLKFSNQPRIGELVPVGEDNARKNYRSASLVTREELARAPASAAFPAELRSAIRGFEKDPAPTLAYAEKLAKRDPDGFEAWRSVYLHAASARSADHTLDESRAWEQGIRRTLGELYPDHEKAEAAYAKLLPCLRRR